MKNLYQCEKCAATYDEYEKALQCESSHRQPDAYNIDNEKNKFRNGENLPFEISVPFGSDYNDANDQFVVTYKIGKIDEKATAFLREKYAKQKAERDEAVRIQNIANKEEAESVYNLILSDGEFTFTSWRWAMRDELKTIIEERGGVNIGEDTKTQTYTRIDK